MNKLSFASVWVLTNGLIICTAMYVSESLWPLLLLLFLGVKITGGEE